MSQSQRKLKPRIKYWPEAGCWLFEAAPGKKLTPEDNEAFLKWADSLKH